MKGPAAEQRGTKPHVGSDPAYSFELCIPASAFAKPDIAPLRRYEGLPE